MGKRQYFPEATDGEVLATVLNDVAIARERRCKREDICFRVQSHYAWA